MNREVLRILPVHYPRMSLRFLRKRSCRSYCCFCLHVMLFSICTCNLLVKLNNSSKSHSDLLYIMIYNNAINRRLSRASVTFWKFPGGQGKGNGSLLDSSHRKRCNVWNGWFKSNPDDQSLSLISTCKLSILPRSLKSSTRMTSFSSTAGVVSSTLWMVLSKVDQASL